MRPATFVKVQGVELRNVNMADSGNAEDAE